MKLKVRKDRPFYINFDNSPFRKGEIINSGNQILRIIKVIKHPWWRRILKRLGFRIKMDVTKVKML